MEESGMSLGAVLGLIGATLTVLIKLFDVLDSWRKNRKDDRRIKTGIDHSIKEIEFINGWLEAVGKSSDDHERETRRRAALMRLDGLMENYRNYCSTDNAELVATASQKNNKAFYALSIFLAMAVLGLFTDDNGDWSLASFEQNMDSDTVLGLAVFAALWAYFFRVSRIYEQRFGGR